MSVICCNDRGAVIDHLQYMNDMYNTPVYSKPVYHGTTFNHDEIFQLKSDLFAIDTPYMYDSQFEKLKELSSCDVIPQKKRKKKRKHEVNDGEQDLIDFHMQVRDNLEKVLDEMIVLAHSLGYLLPPTSPAPDNNLLARHAAHLSDAGVQLSTMCEHTTYHSPRSTSMALDDINEETIFNRLIHYDGDDVCDKRMLDTEFIFPPHCSFLMSDVSNIHPLLHEGGKYDLIVLDPPWFNKSVKRKKKYQMVYDSDLLKLPVPALANDGCLVVVWATNKQQHNFILNEMFPKWNVKFLARWLWLKVTKHGETVCNMNDNHKKPYETIFLGLIGEKTANSSRHINSRCRDSMANESQDQVTNEVQHCVTNEAQDHVTNEVQHCVTNDTQDHVTNEAQDHVTNETQDHIAKESDYHMKRSENLAADFVVLSVPSGIHSHKPPLLELLTPYLPEKPRCLELFARSLQTNWVCWGNEVLHLQEIRNFEKLSRNETNSHMKLQSSQYT